MKQITICEHSLAAYTRRLVELVQEGWEVNYNPIASPERTFTGNYIANLNKEENLNESNNDNRTTDSPLDPANTGDGGGDNGTGSGTKPRRGRKPTS